MLKELMAALQIIDACAQLASFRVGDLPTSLYEMRTLCCDMTVRDPEGMGPKTPPTRKVHYVILVAISGLSKENTIVP